MFVKKQALVLWLVPLFEKERVFLKNTIKKTDFVTKKKEYVWYIDYPFQKKQEGHQTIEKGYEKRIYSIIKSVFFYMYREKNMSVKKIIKDKKCKRRGVIVSFCLLYFFTKNYKE